MKSCSGEYFGDYCIEKGNNNDYVLLSPSGRVISNHETFYDAKEAAFEEIDKDIDTR